MRRKQKMIGCVISLIAAILLAACRETPTPTPTLTLEPTPSPISTSTVVAAVTDTIVPPNLSDTATAPQPTATVTIQPSATHSPTAIPPTATPLPLPPHPPIIVHWLPAPGEEQRIDSPVAITFDQPMDRKSVESAFQIEPAVSGKLEWSTNTLKFLPVSRPFLRDAVYRVTLSAQAKSAAGLPLQEPFSFRFRTVGYLEVTDVQPAPNAVEVDMETDIFVTFNRPVVPLTAIGAQPDLPQPLQLLPSLPGKGEWINTSLYVFRPAEPLLPATTYQARIVAGLSDTTGGVLAEDYIWSFTTKLPAVLETGPFDNSWHVAPTTPITVTFNQPMNHASAEAAFSLLGLSDSPEPGTFRWQGNSMIFTPVSPLKLGTRYRARVAAGALSANGTSGTAHDYEWIFTVIAAPRIVETRPHNGELQADPYTALQVTFSSPMDPSTLHDNLTIIPEPTEVYSSWSGANTRLWLSFGAKPSSSYRVTFGAGLAGRYGHRLGQPYTISFTTRPLSPMVSLSTYGRIGTYNAYNDPTIIIYHRNVSSISFALYRMSHNTFIELNGGDWWRKWEDYRPASGALLRRWSLPVSAPLNERGSARVRIAVEEGGGLPVGIYYLTVTGSGVEYPVRHIMVVTHTNLVIKHGQDEILVWATDLATGQPLPDLRLSIKPEDGDFITGFTNHDGVFRAALEKHDPWSPIFVFEHRQENPTVAISNWSGDISPWMFDLPSEFYGQAPYKGLLYTDRALYRPGQKVYFKGILRADQDGRYSLPDPRNVQVSVMDNQGNEIYKQSLPLSGMGTFYSELTLGEEAPLGRYWMEARVSDGEEPFSFGASFQVAEYRKPEFLVNVAADRDAYTQGDQILVQVEAGYFFGGPVRDAQVQWRVMGQSYFFQWEGGEGWWDFADWDIEDWQQPPTPFGELRAEGLGRTDSEGRFVFRVPADLAGEKMSQVFTIEATVTDVNNQEVSARTGAIVHRGSFYIGMQPQAYVESAGQESKVNIITVDTEGITVANVALDVVFYEHRWYVVQERDPEGLLHWTSKSEDIPVHSTTVTTNDVGWAMASFVPEKGGAYRIRASGRDERGNEVSTSTYTWISSSEYTVWPQENHNRIDLVPDKKSYVPGDVAHILVPSPYQGETVALLTIERGRIMEYQLVRLRSNSEQVAIPITDQYVPNVYVSILVVKGQDETNPVASFRLGYAALTVSPREKELAITLAPDRETYGPGETATYRIQATDYGGRGVEAELSLALIDLSVLTLSGDQGPDLMAAFYQKRGLGIRTASTLALAADAEIQEEAPAKVAKGGSGANEAGPSLRRDFPDTAYWNPALLTSADGQAEVQVKLADSLTTWRMRAQAITADTLVGKAQVDIIATKPLLIRPVAPRFFVAGDKAQLAAVVHNNTDSDILGKVTLQAVGLQVQDAEQLVTIPAHGLAKVTWQTAVLPTDRAELVFSVIGGGLSDAALPSFGVLPVYRYSTPETIATSGQVEQDEPRIEVIQLPEQLDPTQGDLRLELEPSLAAGMRDGLTYLETYPYGCIEQTVSRFLPNVITYRALRRLDLHDEELEQKLPEQVSVGLQRLYALQQVDGGWGWWSSDASQPYLTAYVVFGLNEAQRAGFAVDGTVLKRAVDFLEESLGQPIDIQRGEQANARAYVLYVLAEYYMDHQGVGDLGRAVALYERRDVLGNYGKAYLAMALQLMAPGERSRLDALMSDLATAAIRSATGAHWEEASRDRWTMSSDTRSTAIVLQALVRLQPQSTLIPDVVRWLMTARRRGYWSNTQETALTIIALTDYMVASSELKADYSYRIALNGQLWAEGSVTADTVDQPRELVMPIAELLRDVGNQIWLERQAAAWQSGEGKMYYSAHLRYFLPVGEVQALNRGIIVSRQYSRFEEPDTVVDGARVGDVIQVKLTIIAPNDLYYLVVEDPLPAGCEAVDTSLQTTASTYQAPELEFAKPFRRPYWWYFTHSELRDEKVALFATHLPKGTHEYTYLMRASLPGEFLVMPTHAYEMYFPEVFGRSDGSLFVIAEE